MGRWLDWVLAILMLIGVVFLYLAYPQWTLARIHHALRTEDTATLEALVDWNRLRAGARADFQSLIMRDMKDQKQDGFGALGVMIGSAFTDRMVDAMLSSAEVAKRYKEVYRPDEFVVNYGFVSPSMFRARFRREGEDDFAPVSVLLELNGVTWRLTRALIDWEAAKTWLAANPSSPKRQILDRLKNPAP